MASNIDVTHPIPRHPSTTAERANWQAAHDEITALQEALSFGGSYEGIVEALGYVPYDSVNPAHYQTDVQVATSISALQGLLLPHMDGEAAVGSAGRYAREDHVHPANTSLASTILPLMAGPAAPGTSTKYTREDHIHPVDTSRYAASNPSNYQSNTQVASSIAASVQNYIPLTQRGVALGVATLDGSGIILSAQLPAAATGTLTYKGTWDPVTNTPTLATGGVGGVNRDYYVVSRSGTSVAIDGLTAWVAGDWIVNAGTVWQRTQTSSGFGSMASQNASAVAITGGTATLTSLSILGGSTTSASAEYRNPNIATGWADSVGAIGSFMTADGTWQFGTVGIQAALLLNATITTLNAASGTIGSLTSTTLAATSANITNLAATALTATGGNSVLDSLGIKGAATYLSEPRNPGIAQAWADPTGAIAALLAADGTFRLGTVTMGAATATSMAVSGSFSAANFTPTAVTLGTSTTIVSDRRNRYAEAWTDSVDNGSLMVTNTGSLAFTPASGVLAKHLVNRIERSHMLTQGPPSHTDSANTVGVSGTTYHLTATLDCAGYDAVRLVLPSMRTAGATITACVAVAANATDPVNPKDAAGNPVEWRPVTFGSNGAPVDWEDQPEGTIKLIMNSVATVGTTVLSFADTTGVTSGMICNIPQYNTATGTYIKNRWAQVIAVTPTTVTISKPVQYVNTPSNWPVFFSPNSMVVPSWPGSAGGQSVVLYVSDWIPLSSLDRSDNGRWPLIMVRVFANGTHMTLVTDLSQTDWNGCAKDRIWRCYSQSGDFVSQFNQGNFTATTDNGTMAVGWLQYYSRTRGATIMFVGDSITQGVNGIIPGVGALQLTAYELSTPACPVTNVGMVNGWNNAGVGEYIYTTAMTQVDVFKPQILAIAAWTRNGEFSLPPTGQPAYTQDQADYYWQQCLRIGTKAKRRYRTEVLYYPMGPSDAIEFTSVTEQVRVSALHRAQVSGEMYLDADALLGTGSTPVNDTYYPGLHPPPAAQTILSLDVARQVKNGLGL
jgi:hypothetical protein